MEGPTDPPVTIGPGLRKLVLRRRDSAAGSAPVQPGATVRLRYAVSGATETTKGCDPAAERARLLDEWQGQPAQVFSVTLSQGDALPSVETAVLSMTHGELANFVFSGSAASELQQMVPLLTAAKSLTLTIEVLAVAAAPQLNLAMAASHKDAGNAAFKEKDYGLALEEYMQAIDVAEQLQHRTVPEGRDMAGEQTEEEAATLRALQLDAHNNISLCNIHTSSFATALHHCNIVLAADSANAKALNRRARAYKGLHDFISARHDCEAILRLAEGGDSVVTARVAKDAQALLLASRSVCIRSGMLFFSPIVCLPHCNTPIRCGDIVCRRSTKRSGKSGRWSARPSGELLLR